jgi:hypothetical protein
MCDDNHEPTNTDPRSEVFLFAEYAACVVRFVQCSGSNSMPRILIAEEPPWQPDDPCPCGSSRTFGNCCARSPYPRIEVPSLTPPPPQTGYANSKCYLSATNDCHKRISREHYISDAVLRAIPGQLIVSGGAWQRRGTSQEMRRESLTTRILCERHNRSLSPLDAAAGRLFQTIRAIYENFRAGVRLPGSSWSLHSGEMLELWSLKVIFGLHRGGVGSGSGGSIRDTHSLDLSKLMHALTSQRLEDPCGMYATTHEDQSPQTVRFGVAVLPIGTDDRIGGVRMRVHGLAFHFIFDPSAVDRQLIKQGVYRPRYLTFRKSVQHHTVMLTWPPSRRLLEPELAVTFPE